MLPTEFNKIGDFTSLEWVDFRLSLVKPKERHQKTIFYISDLVDFRSNVRKVTIR